MVICIYSSNFQIRLIQVRNQHFSGDKSLLLVGQWKKNIFSGKANIKKFILPLEKYLKTLKDMIIGTAGT